LRKEPKTHDGEKTASFSLSRCPENWTSTCRRLKLDPCFSPCTKIKDFIIDLKKDLIIRPETLKQLLEAVGHTGTERCRE
jgi:hypothetical protein